MKKTLAFALSLLLLTASLSGCGRRGNVSDNENGMITENTSRTEATLPTTHAPTENSTTETTHRETVSPMNPTTSTTESTDTGSLTEDLVPSEGNGNTGDNARSRSRHHSGIMGGRNRYTNF